MRTNIAECSKYTIQLCEKEKRVIERKQRKYKDETGRFLSIERAIKHIIIESEEKNG